MPERVRKFKQRRESVNSETPNTTTAERRDSVTDDTDALLDEIDAALEGMDESTATEYVQRGGQ